MNAAFWLSLVMATAGCLGLILAGKGMWQGWAIGLAVQPVWAVFAIVTKGYGLLITCCMYGFVYAKNLLKWRERTKEIEESVSKERFPQIIIAGTERQALDYVFTQGWGPEFDYIIVRGFQSIEGYRFRKQDVHRVGTYYERKDLLEIEELVVRTTAMFKESNE